MPTTNLEHDDNRDYFSVAVLPLRHRLLRHTDSSLKLVLTVVIFECHDTWLLPLSVDVSDSSTVALSVLPVPAFIECFLGTSRANSAAGRRVQEASKLKAETLH